MGTHFLNEEIQSYVFTVEENEIILEKVELIAEKIQLLEREKTKLTKKRKNNERQDIPIAHSSGPVKVGWIKKNKTVSTAKTTRGKTSKEKEISKIGSAKNIPEKMEKSDPNLQALGLDELSDSD